MTATNKTAAKKAAQAAAAPTTPAVKGKARNKKNIIPIQNGAVAVYASPRISKALDEITEDMTLYHGVRFTQILEAVYTQGKKDGARSAFDELDKKIKEAQKAIPHKNPGKPRKAK